LVAWRWFYGVYGFIPWRDSSVAWVRLSFSMRAASDEVVIKIINQVLMF
jgi:hypothetical protein